VRRGLRSAHGSARGADASIACCFRMMQGKDVPILYTTDGTPLDAPAQWSLFCESQAAWYLTLILCQFW
jgi:hypothetical protein